MLLFRHFSTKINKTPIKITDMAWDKIENMRQVESNLRVDFQDRLTLAESTVAKFEKDNKLQSEKINSLELMLKQIQQIDRLENI